MEIITLIAALSTLLVAVLILARTGRSGANQEAEKIKALMDQGRTETSDSLRKVSAELSTIIAASSAGVREALADRLSGGLTEMRDRVETQLKSGREESFKSLEAIREKVDNRLMEIGNNVQAKLDENIKEGFAHFEKVQEHLKKAETQLVGLSAVGVSINELNSLLKLPHLRGGFGEAALELLLSEFLPTDLYELQAAIGTSRVDVLIKLPGAKLPIDSKFPREQVLPLFDCCEAGKLAEARKALSTIVKAQAKEISDKYVRPELGTTNMALMFLPSETLYFEIVRDAELWAALSKLKVYPVSPNTLAVTLNGIRISYDYYQMAKGVEQTVENIRKARKHFGDFEKKFEDIGKSLSKAQDAYHTASTHIGRYSSSVTRLTGESASLIEEIPE